MVSKGFGRSPGTNPRNAELAAIGQGGWPTKAIGEGDAILVLVGVQLSWSKISW